MLPDQMDINQVSNNYLALQKMYNDTMASNLSYNNNQRLSEFSQQFGYHNRQYQELPRSPLNQFNPTNFHTSNISM